MALGFTPIEVSIFCVTPGTFSLALGSFGAPPTHAISWLGAPRAPAAGASITGVPNTDL